MLGTGPDRIDMSGGYIDSAIETLEDMGYYDESEMTVGLDCCPHYVPYGSDCDQCDEDEADNAMGLTVPNVKLTGARDGASTK